MSKNGILKKVANLAESIAIKSNGMTSWWDSYQPVEPESLRKLVENQSKKNNSLS